MLNVSLLDFIVNYFITSFSKKKKIKAYSTEFMKTRFDRL